MVQMRTDAERIERLHERAAQLRRRRDRKQLAACGGASVFLLAVLGVMLGVMIQLTLAASEQRQRWQAGERLARAMTSTAVQTTGSR